MTSPEGWTCGRCRHPNGSVVLQCGRCERALADADAIVVAGVEMPGREWLTLLLAQLWLFFAVAGADGHVDDAEIARVRWVHRARGGDPLLAAMKAVLEDDFWGLVERHGADRRSVPAGLADVRAVLASRLPEARASQVRIGLLALGVSVAGASGRSVFALRRRIQPDEAVVLGKAADALGATEEERRAAGLGARR